MPAVVVPLRHRAEPVSKGRPVLVAALCALAVADTVEDSAGRATGLNWPNDVLVGGHSYGSLSMTSYTVGMPAAVETSDAGGAAPSDSDLPADQCNI